MTEPQTSSELSRYPEWEHARITRRTRICIWVIVLGFVNFLLYSIVYVFIGGEAINGWTRRLAGGEVQYFLQSGHQVSLGEYLYSGIHSVSIWLTVAAIMLAMLTLAKDRIVSSMRDTIIRGRTFITILATVITLTTAVIMIFFILQFANKLANPPTEPPPQVRSVDVSCARGAWRPVDQRPHRDSEAQRTANGEIRGMPLTFDLACVSASWASGTDDAEMRSVTDG